MTEPTPKSDDTKSDDKKDIELEEREQMMNAENNKTAENSNETESENAKNKLDAKEGREVKPKKIPIGGIQMPGFFTRSKSKERCKDGETEQQSDVEGSELIEQKEETNVPQTQTRIKLPNPFRKSKVPQEEGDKVASEPKEKRNLLNTIRLPLVSVCPLKKKDEQDGKRAGLASMETLGDKSGDETMKEVALDEKRDMERQETVSSKWRQWLKTYKMAVGVGCFFVLVLLVLIIIIVSHKERQGFVSPVRDGKYVEAVTSCGKVEGMLDGDAVAFRGIPYARPPVGDLRFQHAQPLNNLKYCWNGTLLTHNTTAECLQIESNGTVIGAEDCLTLDVVTPYVRYDLPLPVIVLIGAETLIGGSPGKMRPSTRHARSKDVVFVRPKFRMGILGFLAVQALSNDSYPHYSGNYGLSDIVQALRWVQLNIENFGGDKESVMLFGHRAGATLVTALSTMKDAEKLFKKAWASSGSALFPKRELSESEVDNQSFMSHVQCETAACLRQLDAEYLTRAVMDTWRKPQPDLPAKNENPHKRHEWLVLDGMLLREYPSNVWTREEGLKVKLVLGTTAHPATSQKLLLKHKEWTTELVKKHENESFLTEKNLLEEASEKYPATLRGLVTMISDIRTVCPLFAISTQMRDVPFYVVNQTRGPLADIDSDVDAILGRYHTHTTEQRRYFSEIQNLFYHFVWHGKVVVAEQTRHKVLIVNQVISPAAYYSHCDYWIKKNVVLPYADLD